MCNVCGHFPQVSWLQHSVGVEYDALQSIRTSVCVFQALVGEKACYQSVSSYAGQIVYLGTKVLRCFCSICCLWMVFVYFSVYWVVNSCCLSFWKDNVDWINKWAYAQIGTLWVPNKRNQFQSQTTPESSYCIWWHILTKYK